jgi:hypothetical protein
MWAFLQQLPALIGVVVGAVGSYFAIALGDRARFRREEAARWQDRRLTVYSDYTRAVKMTVTVTFRLAAHFGNDPHPHPLTPERAATQLAAASDPRDMAWEAMLLLGSPDVVDAAREWFVRAADMERFVQREIRDPDQWSALLERQRSARTTFYDAARRDLALPPGHSGRWRPPASRPRPDQPVPEG